MTPEPEPSLPPGPEQRNFVGWFVLFVLFGLMIWSAVASSVSHSPEKVVSASAGESYLVKAVEDRLSNSANAKKSHDDLVEATKAVERKEVRSDSSSRLLVAMQGEAKRPISKTALSTLEKHPSPENDAIVAIYTGNVKQADIAKITDALPSGEALTRAAVVRLHEELNLKPPAPTKASKAFKATASILFVLSILTGLMVWAGLFPAMMSGSVRPLGLKLSNITAADADALAFYAAIAFLVLNVAEMIVAVVQIAFDLTRLQSAILFLAVPVAVIPVFSMRLLGRRISLKDIGISFDHMTSKVFTGCIGFVCEWPVSLAILAASNIFSKFLPKAEHPLTTELANNHNLGMIAVAFVTASIIAPITEEIIFRGLLFPALSRLTGKVWVGGLISSLLFASLHPQGISAWLALASVGGFSCALSYYTKSLVPSIILHALHNTTILVLGLALS